MQIFSENKITGVINKKKKIHKKTWQKNSAKKFLILVRKEKKKNQTLSNEFKFSPTKGQIEKNLFHGGEANWKELFLQSLLAGQKFVR